LMTDPNSPIIDFYPTGMLVLLRMSYRSKPFIGLRYFLIFLTPFTTNLLCRFSS
jgi:hypothetical protein